MPFKETKEGYVYDKNGPLKLPPGPAIWSQPKPAPPPTSPQAPKKNGS